MPTAIARLARAPHSLAKGLDEPSRVPRESLLFRPFPARRGLTTVGSVATDSCSLTIAHVVGARPNFVKTAPVIRELRIAAPELQQIVIHTGQHYDRELSDLFFHDLDMPEPTHMLGVGSDSHGAQTARALERIEAALLETGPHAVLVPGDVNSTLAGALAAVKLGIPVAHLEAGLRSFDRSMPEEVNRILVDQISNWCFIHSPEAAAHLQREGVGDDRIHFVGNTMIDSLVRMEASYRDSDVLERLGLVERGYLLVTLHRPKLVDGQLFELVVAALALISHDLPVVFPMHPRARARLSPDHERPPSLHLVDPLGYVDFLALEAGARGVVTDSGGVQEETSYLGVPCFTLRDNTERPITISDGTNRLLGLRPDALELVPRLLNETSVAPPPPFGWDGRAASRVARVLLNDLAGGTEPAVDVAEMAARR